MEVVGFAALGEARDFPTGKDGAAQRAYDILTCRARVDLARYHGYLLGLPQELLGDTPQSIVDFMLTRFAALRKGFDGDL